MGLQVTDDEGAAMGEHHQRPGLFGGPVVAQRQPVRPVQVFHAGRCGASGPVGGSPS
ncbi:hypothetical protein ACWDRB_57730 [Nonomuraea sp. NPDC003707]